MTTLFPFRPSDTLLLIAAPPAEGRSAPARLPSPAVRLAVDLTLCQGYAECAFLAPDVFRFVGNEALMYVPEPDESMRVNVLRAAAACPVGAILVDVDDLSTAP